MTCMPPHLLDDTETAPFGAKEARAVVGAVTGSSGAPRKVPGRSSDSPSSEATAEMPSNVLILGAGGQIARHVIAGLGRDERIRQTLFLRNTHKLNGSVPGNARVTQGDVLDETMLAAVMMGQDIVYANLTGDDLDVQAQAVIDAMQAMGVKRLVFVLSLGIYDELPGRFQQWNQAMIGEYLKPFRRAADAIEASGLDYTIVRPAWLTDEDGVDYEITAKGETFKGTEVSRKSVANLIADIILTPSLHVGGSLGIDKHGTDGDKPAFY